MVEEAFSNFASSANHQELGRRTKHNGVKSFFRQHLLGTIVRSVGHIIQELAIQATAKAPDKSGSIMTTIAFKQLITETKSCKPHSNNPLGYGINSMGEMKNAQSIAAKVIKGMIL